MRWGAFGAPDHVDVPFDNAIALCRAHHTFFTDQTAKWRRWVEKTLGPKTIDRIRLHAAMHRPPDVDAVISELRAQLRMIKSGKA